MNTEKKNLIDLNEKWRRRTVALSKYFSSQVLVQLILLCVGIFLVRYLNPTEFALLTIVLSMQGTINTLSDMGAGSALTSIAGKVWGDKKLFSQLVRTYREYRSKLLFWSIVLISPILFWTLKANGASATYSSLLCILVIFTVRIQFFNAILDFTLRMYSRLDLLQKSDMIGAACRAILTLAVTAFFGNALISILAVIFGLLAQNLILKKYTSQYLDNEDEINESNLISMKKSVRSLGANSLFYCIQGQIVVFIISIFGNVYKVADVGALSRLGFVFVITNIMTNNIVVPRFARCQEELGLRKIYWNTIFVLFIFSTFLIASSYFYPQVFLWILGENYSHLGKLLPYGISSVAIASLGAAVYSLNCGKSWIRFSWLSIPIIVITQIFMVWVVDLSSVRDVLLLSIIPTAMGLFPFLIEGYFSIGRIEPPEPQST